VLSIKKAPDKSPKKGFTILELMIWLVLVSIVASFAIPAFFDRAEVTLDNACTLLLEDLRGTQNRAAYNRAVYLVAFRPDGDGYAVTDRFGHIIPHPMGGGDYERLYSTDAVFQGVEISHVNFGDDLVIEYDEQGFAVNGGAVELSFRGKKRIILVEPGTGMLEVHGMDRDWYDDGR
jgi:prepilin-type N-terminal cleavage/methylation domain-containing protein